MKPDAAGGGAFIPYGRHWIEDDDVAAVVNALRSGWLTTGPLVPRFEGAFARVTGADHAVALSSGTAGLHAAMHALGVGPGDEVIVPPITFVATANCAVFQGARPVFADVQPDTLLLDPEDLERKITRRTRAIIAVDYAGHPCDYDRLAEIARNRGVALVADACHALGARFRGRPVGSLAHLNVFSLHPVKAVTAGEGGVVTTDDPSMADRMRRFRNHGISLTARERDVRDTWIYEVAELGFNYRITDIQCALGLSQLGKLERWTERRRRIARRYDEAFRDLPQARPLTVRPWVQPAYHLYVLLLNPDALNTDRRDVFLRLRARGIGVNVHYIPVHLHPYYRERFGTGPGLCPVAEAAYERLLTLPLFPAMSDHDVDRVIDQVTDVLRECAR